MLDASKERSLAIANPAITRAIFLIHELAGRGFSNFDPGSVAHCELTENGLLGQFAQIEIL
jgi:hypothetical protein